MEKRFMVVLEVEGGEVVLGHDVTSSDVLPLVVGDALAAGVLPNLAPEQRMAPVEMAAITKGFLNPTAPTRGAIYARMYRIEELPDDPGAAAEFLSVRLADPKVLRLVYHPVRGEFRIEIWPNESQHRGRPHCRVSKGERAASFDIPDGTHINGKLGPDQGRAEKLVKQHGSQLLELWHKMRPDDQRL